MLCVGFFRYPEGKMSKNSEQKTRCVVCGMPLRGGCLCDCCRESFALCDIEEYARRKACGKNCPAAAANAFKKGGFMVQ